jgi:hypothetical protein
MKIKKTLALFLLSFLLIPAARGAVGGDTYLIDAPSAEILPVRAFGINTRVFSGGGLLSYFDFAVSGRFSIGVSETAEHIIGTNDEEIKLLVPALQMKFRAYDGDNTFPALAVGFDNQGFMYDHGENKYLQTARGAYVVLSKEILTPGLILTPGANITVNGFEFDKPAVFVGASYNISDIFAVMAEWDNVRSIADSRVNGGLRVYLYDSFSIDFALRNFNNKAERVVQLKYIFTL